MVNNLEISQCVDNLMGYLFVKLYEKDMLISQNRMQNFIFKIKMELTKDHELYDKLPYYWYFCPFSEVVKDSFLDITNKYCKSRSENSYILNHEYANLNNNDLIVKFSEIEDITDKILKNENEFYNEAICKNYAPYKCMYKFKYAIFDIADKFRNTCNFDIDGYIDTFYDCEARLPIDDYFNDFAEIYSQFSTNLEMINREGNFNENWQELRYLICELWKTFVKGVRVNSKDYYYDFKTASLDFEFKNKLKFLSILVNDTEKLTSINRVHHYSDAQKRILNSTIGSYLNGYCSYLDKNTVLEFIKKQKLL